MGKSGSASAEGGLCPKRSKAKTTSSPVAFALRPPAAQRSTFNTNFVPIIKSCCSGRICRLAQQRHAQAYIVARPIPILISSFCSLAGFISHTPSGSSSASHHHAHHGPHAPGIRQGPLLHPVRSENTGPRQTMHPARLAQRKRTPSHRRKVRSPPRRRKK
jgi:hypothetical protein